MVVMKTINDFGGFLYSNRFLEAITSFVKNPFPSVVYADSPPVFGFCDTHHSGGVIFTQTHVFCINHARSLSEIYYSIIGSNMVDMVNLFFRPNSMNVKPCKSVGKVSVFSPKSYSHIPVATNLSRWGFFLTRVIPKKLSGFRDISERGFKFRMGIEESVFPNTPARLSGAIFQIRASDEFDTSTRTRAFPLWVGVPAGRYIVFRSSSDYSKTAKSLAGKINKFRHNILSDVAQMMGWWQAQSESGFSVAKPMPLVRV